MRDPSALWLAISRYGLGVYTKHQLFFEQANQESLFDEITEIGFDDKAKLLRALEAREPMLLGGIEPILLEHLYLCVKFNLEDDPARGNVTQNSLYPLNVFRSLPPLGKRKEPIKLLAAKFRRI